MASSKDPEILRQCVGTLVAFKMVQGLEQLDFHKLIDLKLSVQGSIDALHIARSLPAAQDVTRLIAAILDKQTSVIAGTTQIQTVNSTSLAVTCEAVAVLFQCFYVL